MNQNFAYSSILIVVLIGLLAVGFIYHDARLDAQQTVIEEMVRLHLGAK